ncbi:MAG: hypothetical protein AAB545_00205 [Patescibacteria group bacterium]
MKTNWYLRAVDDDPTTNDYLVGVIGEQNPELLHKDMLCADGKRRNFFECPNGYPDVRRAFRAISRFNLRIHAFKQEPNQPIVRFTLHDRDVEIKTHRSHYLRGVRRGNEISRPKH